MRIASLISSATEMLFALGLEDSMVAVSHECDYPPAALAKPRVTRSHVAVTATSLEIDEQVHALTAGQMALYEIDVDRLVALRPDLIVTQAQCDVCAVRYADVLTAVASRSELMGTRVLALNPQSLGEVLADIAALGTATGAARQAAALRDRLAVRIAAVRAATADLTPAQRPRVVLIEWIEPLMLSGNWMPEMVAWAGGCHDLTATGRHSPYVSWEALAAYDPQAIFVMPCGFELPRTLAECHILERQPCWQSLSAVRSGRVWAIDGNAYFNRSGPRLVDSLEILGHLLHPECIGRPPQFTAQSPWQQLG